MLRNYSKTAEKICKIRWNFLKDIDPLIVLDYGSGVGWFRAFRPEGVIVDNYDIAKYPQTGITRDSYELICFWDVLEHIPNFKVIAKLLKHSSYVVCSLPIKPKNVKLKKWKHYKPNEHLHYFSMETLDTLFETHNFEKIKYGYPECPPREDIYTALYKKK